MKFKHYLSSIVDVDIFPILGLVIFVPMFLFIIYWVFKTDKKHFTQLAEMPLQDGTET